jgi:hypothetical protein
MAAITLKERLRREARAEAARTHYKSLPAGARSSSKTPILASQETSRRNGDRGDDDGDADADAADGRPSRLPELCRFADLVQANITSNWPHLLRLIEVESCPRGIMLSKNIRTWPVDEVLRWMDARPTARKIVAPARKPRRRSVAKETVSTA